MSDTTQYCTFKVGGQMFGIEVREVQEVIRFQEMTRVPRAAAEVAGLINLRGQIVIAIDLRTRLGMDPRPGAEPPMNVVVRTDETAVSLLVDEIGEVLQLEAGTFEQPPLTLAGIFKELITGVHKLKDSLLLILNTQAAVGLGSRSHERAEAA